LGFPASLLEKFYSVQSYGICLYIRSKLPLSASIIDDWNEDKDLLVELKEVASCMVIFFYKKDFSKLVQISSEDGKNLKDIHIIIVNI
jgi:hypothetical protein